MSNFTTVLVLSFLALVALVVVIVAWPQRGSRP